MNRMKNINSTIAVIFFASVSVLTSCSKERIEAQEDETQLNDYQAINSYFDTKKQDEQEFVIDTSGSGPIVGNQGTKIWASKEKLMFANGDSVHWPYTVKLIELYTPKDMIYYQMPNLSGANLMTTHGEVRVRAFKDGQELVLRPACTWTVEMPNAGPQSNMKICYGSDNGSFVDWLLTPPGDFIVTAYGYTGEIAKLGWVLCGKNAYGSVSTTNYTFSSTTDDLQNVATFIYFPDAKSLMQVYNQTSGAIPVGEDCKIVLIGINSSNELFHYYSSTQVSTSNQIGISLTSITDPDLTTILDNL